jgi:catechol 2,3-dioxygenase-like lactoylglutathione lyase family enzyme
MRKQSAFIEIIVRNFAGAAQRLVPRPSESLLNCSSTRGNAVAAPPSFPHLPQNEQNRIALPLVKALWLVGLLLPFGSSSVGAAIAVERIGLTVANLDYEIEFYTRVLSFERISLTTNALGTSDVLLGLSGTRLRTADLKLGDEHILLTEHLTNKGRPIPPDSRSFDHWFQHIAIVVKDMDRAYQVLRSQNVKHVSTSPQTLPPWNKEAGGIKAFYFRDPEDHVLELIWFPAGKGDSKWQKPATASGGLFLGIDHTAIVVSDTQRSLAFYRDLLGLRVAGTAENYGTEQEHLNQVFGARLRITALRADQGPGIEFLEYIAPPGGRVLPPDAKPKDLLFWETHLAAEASSHVLSRVREDQTRVVSRNLTSTSPFAQELIVRDPDGHAVHLLQKGPATASLR